MNSIRQYNDVDTVELLEKIQSKHKEYKPLYNKLHALMVKQLETNANTHKRTANDWRISHQIDCNFARCGTLKRFLNSRSKQTLDLPLKKKIACTSTAKSTVNNYLSAILRHGKAVLTL